MDEPIALAVIGGSGLYGLPDLKDTVESMPDTPFGKPSAPVLIGDFEGHRVAFLARHGIGHHLMPSEVPYRANIFALKTLGADRIVSISACGSLREDFAPGEIVVPDQLYDNTRDRIRTFFGGGLVAHLSVPDPFCPDLSDQLFGAVVQAGGQAHRGGTFITIEGPRFSTKGESRLFRQWGMGLIGMTTSPEAFLAREAEMCYAVMAHVTDYDVWHLSVAPVTVDAVIRILARNTELAVQAIRQLVNSLRPHRACDCETALAGALITRRDAIPEATIKKLQPLIHKYISP
jgi:5'-methylthioadenosine phosphorylase